VIVLDASKSVGRRVENPAARPDRPERRRFDAGTWPARVAPTLAARRPERASARHRTSSILSSVPHDPRSRSGVLDMTLRFTIDQSGNFDPSTLQTENQGTVIEFGLSGRASWVAVYIYSGSPLALDANLFGSSSVRVANGGTIQTTAVIDTIYTLSVSDDEIRGGQTGIKNGTIKVGGA
jgi:hypothetical protein